MNVFPKINNYLTENKSLYFSHGFGLVFNEQTKIVPPKNIDILMICFELIFLEKLIIN